MVSQLVDDVVESISPPQNFAGHNTEHGTREIIESLFEAIGAAGQRTVLRYWDTLSEVEREQFVRQLAGIDWTLIAERRRICLQVSNPSTPPVQSIQPPRRVITRPQTSADFADWEAARTVGNSMLRRGEVGVVLVAGGSGTRLGFDHPKGMFPIGPVTNRSLFQHFAEQILTLTHRHEVRIPLMIMTADATHDETVAWFTRHDWFGLNAGDVFFFQQGCEPTMDSVTGELLLAGPGSLVMSPNGHGGLPDAMQRAGLFEELRRRNVQTLFYHQVDNPLVQVCDSAFLGFHAQCAAQVSTKVIVKQEPEERVGVVVEIEGREQIIEYSDLPSELAVEREDNGQLRFRAGNTAIHVFQADFLELAATRPGGLPWHRVYRRTTHLDSGGQYVQPAHANGLKFERFIFDVMPIAESSLILEADRATEFAPLKNAEGDCSPAEVRQAMNIVELERLRQAGVDIPDGITVEISAQAVLPGEPIQWNPMVNMPEETSWVLGPQHISPAASPKTAGQTARSRTALGPLTFGPRLVPRVWGGRALGEVLGHSLQTHEPYGEVWDVCALENAVSVVDDGPHCGTALTELWSDFSHEMHGQHHSSSLHHSHFPLLIKWLECRDWLSLQVHPDDHMARRVLNQPCGKSEAWIVLEAEPDARVMAGIRPGVSRDEFIRHLQAGTLENCLHSFRPQPGDCIVLPAGTVHAAGGGLLIAEVQQSSDATFRLYDWNRMGLDGKPRALQVELALEAIDWSQGPIEPVRPVDTGAQPHGARKEFLSALDSFSLTRYTVERPWVASHAGELTLWMVLEGTAKLVHSQTGHERTVPRGRTVMIPATAGETTWSPASGQSISLLCIRIPRR